MTEDEIRQALSDRKLNVVADRIGHPYSEVRRFAKGVSVRPTWQLVNALEKYLTEGVGK